MTTKVPAAMLAADVATQAALDAESAARVAATTNIPASALASTLNLSSKTLTLPAANTPAFTKSFTSAAQTVTLGGLLTLAHGLGVVPLMFQARAKCVTTEGGWAVNDEVLMNGGGDHIGVGNGYGIAVYADATNVYVRFGNTGFYPGLLNKTTGNIAGATAANWNLIMKAWA